jgi:hypothetical protein
VFSTTRAQEYIRVTDALSKHAHNLRAEHMATLKRCAGVCLGALNPFQFATLVVQSRPVVPDALAVVVGVLADMAANEQTQPPAMEGVAPATIGNTTGSIVPSLVCSSGEQDPAGAMMAAAAAGVMPAASGDSTPQPSALQLLLSMPRDVRGAGNIAEWLQVQYGRA